jgi:hypothetical protein
MPVMSAVIAAAQSRPSFEWMSNSRSLRNAKRLSLARLQAESATCKNSPQGLDAVMRPVLGQVCQRAIWSANCTRVPAASGRLSAGAQQSARGERLEHLAGGDRPQGPHSPSSTASRMNSSLTRTEWLACWNASEATTSSRGYPAAS